MSKNKKIKFYISLVISVLVFVCFCNSYVSADIFTESPDVVQTDAFLDATDFDTTASVGSVMAMVIKAFLGLLGIIFVILIITAGYNWMTAAGEEEKVNKAKDTLKRAMIGLIIVVSAYAITYFVFKNLPV